MESGPAFLDHHVAAVAGMIPSGLRINGNTEKWVLREAMRQILPEPLYKCEKFAFMGQPGHTSVQKQQALQLLINRFLSAECVENAGIFDPERLKKYQTDYRLDRDPVSLVRKDALLNHIIGLHIMQE